MWRTKQLTAMIAIAGLWVSTAYSQQTPAAPAPALRGVEITSESLVGSKVRNTDGREIGSVKSLMIEPVQGKINSVAIALGGVLGVGTKTVLVPWQSVMVGRDGQTIVVTVQEALLEQAPAASPRATDQQPSPQPSR
jgi:sporulation protein YlmC with PRC-barrel domain